MEWSLIIAMAIFSFTLSVTPGPNNAALLALGGRFGFRGTLPYLGGMVLGLLVLVAVMAAGLGALLELWPIAYQVMKYLAFAYVLYLAWRMIASRKVMGSSSGDSPVSVLQAALFQLVNPKAWIATGTLIAAYVPADASVVDFVIAGSTFVIATMPGAAIWAFSGLLVNFLLSGSRAHRIVTVVLALALVASMVPVLFL